MESDMKLLLNIDNAISSLQDIKDQYRHDLDHKQAYALRERVNEIFEQYFDEHRQIDKQDIRITFHECTVLDKATSYYVHLSMERPEFLQHLEKSFDHLKNVRLLNQSWRFKAEPLKIIEIINNLEEQYHKWTDIMKLNIFANNVSKEAISHGIRDIKNLIDKLRDDLKEHRGSEEAFQIK